MGWVEGGFPHSEIRGSKPVRGSPRLIAAYHVLHRLSAPRHPPDTLLSLDRSPSSMPSGLPRASKARTAPTLGLTRPGGATGSAVGLEPKDLCFRTCPRRRAVKAPRHPAAPPDPALTAGRGRQPCFGPSGFAASASFARLAAAPSGRTHSLFTMSNNRLARRRAPARRMRAAPGLLCAGRGSPSRTSRWARFVRPPRPHAEARWWSKTGSNRRPHACKARALPTELLPQRVRLEAGRRDAVTGGPGKTRTSDLTLIKRAL